MVVKGTDVSNSKSKLEVMIQFSKPLVFIVIPPLVLVGIEKLTGL